MQFPTETSELTLTVTPEFPALLIGLITTGFDGAGFHVFDTVLVPAGQTGHLTLSAIRRFGDDSVCFIAPQFFDGVPCGGGEPFGNGDVATWSRATPPAACPTLGGRDGDGTVDVDDLLMGLGNVGPWP